VTEFAWLLVAQQDHGVIRPGNLSLQLGTDLLYAGLLQLAEIFALVDLGVFGGSHTRTPPPGQQAPARGERFLSQHEVLVGHPPEACRSESACIGMGWGQDWGQRSRSDWLASSTRGCRKRGGRGPCRNPKFHALLAEGADGLALVNLVLE